MTSRISVRGRYLLTAMRGDELLWQITQDNFVTDQGLSYMASAALQGGAVQPSWYVGIKGGYDDALPTDTLASKLWPEVNAGSSTRPQWVATSVQPGRVSNYASPAVITFTVDAEVSGVFLASGPSVGATSDLLFSVADWLTEQPMRAGDKISAIYEMNLEAADV